MTSQSNEIDIAPMLNDINKVLKGHLTAILGPMINEKNAIQNVLLNMPYVKNLKTQNEVLKTQIIQLKAELNGLKVYYERELENASKKNVKLEVRDSKTGEPETPSKIVELKKSMWTKNTKVNTEEEDDDLYGESDDDDNDEDEDDDDDDMSEYEECNKCEKMNNIDLLQDGSCLKCLADDKKNDIVEITSNGTVESNNEEEDIKTVTVWNLNNTNKEVEKEKEDEEVDEHKEDEEEDDEEEEDEEGEEEDDDDDEQNDEEEEEEEDDDEEEGDEEEEEEEEYEEDDDEEDMEVEDVEIDGVQYLTTSPINGKIFKCDEDGEMEEDENGDFIICGYFKEGIANFI